MKKNIILAIGTRPAFELYLQKARRLNVDTSHIRFVRDSHTFMGFDRDTQVVVLHGASADLCNEAYDRFGPENIKRVSV